jgi:hypothetical protein
VGVQAWMIKSWPTCEWYLPNDQNRWPALRHAHTEVRQELDGEGRRFGETVWCARVNGQAAGAAWEWTELAPGVVLLSNPNCVATNLHLFNAEHQSLDALSELVALNTFVRSLPWQATVCAALDRGQPAAVAARGGRTAHTPLGAHDRALGHMAQRRA